MHSKPCQSLHRVLQTAVDTYYCNSLLTSLIHFDDDLNQKSGVIILSDLFTLIFSSCAIWHTAGFSPCFPFLKDGFLTATLPLKPYLMRL